MYDRLNVRAKLVYAHMHLDLRRRTIRAIRGDYLTLCVNLTDHIHRHKALGNACGGAKELIIIQLYADIAIIGGNHASIIDTAANVQNLFLNLILSCHG